MTKLFQAFEAPLSGISLVEASAGTGKTYNITSLYIRAILEKKLLPAQILVLTFTEAATAELKSRLRDRLKDALNVYQTGETNQDDFLDALISQNYTNAETLLKQALEHFDEASIFTIHGFCNRLLNEHSLQFNVNPDFNVLADESELLQDCVDDYWRTFVRSAKSREDLFMLEYLVDSGFGPDELSSIVKEVLGRPYAKLVPEDLNLKELKSSINDFYQKFEEIKSLKESDLDGLRAILYDERLNGKKYNKKYKEDYWNEFIDCLEAEEAAFSFVEPLIRFGSKLCNSGNRGHTFEKLDITHAIDDFCEIAENLKLLKPAFILDSVDIIQQDFEKRKAASNTYSYNDFLSKVDEGLRNDDSGLLTKKLAEKYPIALVDEFQDTDPIQYNIFRQIYHHREDTALFMIGDPKQAIYGFRGADIYTYLEAKKDADEQQRYQLEYNFRSNDKMIEAVNEIFSKSDSPFLIDDLNFQKANFPEGKKEKQYLVNNANEALKALQCIKLDESDTDFNKGESEYLICDAVVNEIVELLNNDYSIKGEKVKEKDIAILVRKGSQGEKIQQKLRDVGIKSVLKSNTSVFETREAEELLLILNSVQKNFYDPGLRAALATQIMGRTASELQSLLDDEAAWANIVQDFTEIKKHWEEEGIETTLEHLFRKFKVKENLAIKPDAERVIANLMHLSELLTKAEREQKVTGKGLLKWFYRKIEDTSTKTDEEQLRLESDEDLIQISTVHASKGLEYPIVFCPFLWTESKKKTISESYRFYQDGKIHININTGIERLEHQNLDLHEELNEVTRLMYVALTRSAYASYIFLPKYKDIRLSPIASVLFGKHHAIKEARIKTSDSNFEYQDLIDALDNCENITLRNPVEYQDFINGASDVGELDFIAKTFSRHDVFNFPRVISYSSLTRSDYKPEDSAHDFDDDVNVNDSQTTALEKNRFHFPKGANAGTCLHQIFEDLEFSNRENIDQIVEKNLNLTGISLEWKSIVIDWVNQVLAHSLKTPPTTIGNLSEKDVLKEMEFHFPAEKIQSSVLWDLIRSEVKESSPFHQDEITGFMKGFIDLIFRVGDKYFILDYKSNYLGDSLKDYSSDALKSTIHNSAYDFQYHIYSLALHKLLKQRISDYNYDYHFGGVLYLFLRGVDVKNSGSGVFFDKPDSELIENMDRYYETGGIHAITA